MPPEDRFSRISTSLGLTRIVQHSAVEDTGADPWERQRLHRYPALPCAVQSAVHRNLPRPSSRPPRPLERGARDLGSPSPRVTSHWTGFHGHLLDERTMVLF